MFYDLDLLCRQRKGRFSLIWLAGTRGIKHLKKSSINKVKISSVCDEILKFVMSDSSIPRQRLSLYLSAQLMHGAVLIFKQQVNHLEVDTIFYANCIARPLLSEVFDDEMVSKKPKKILPKGLRSKQDPQAKETMEAPQELLPWEEIASDTNVLNAIHITLPEDVSIYKSINVQVQETFGDEDDDLFKKLDLFSDLEATSLLEPNPVSTLPEAETTKSKTDKHLITSEEDVGQSPNKRRRFETSDVSPLVKIQEHGDLSPEEIDRILMPPPSRPAPKRVRFSLTKLTNDEIRKNIERTRSPLIYKNHRQCKRKDTVRTLKKFEFDSINNSPIVNEILTKRHLQKPYVSREKIEENTKDIIAEIFRTVKHTEEDLQYVLSGFELDFMNDLDNAFNELSKGVQITELEKLDEGHQLPVSKSDVDIQEPLLDLPNVPLLKTPNFPRAQKEISILKENKRQEDIVDVSQFHHERPDVGLMQSINVSRIHTSLPMFDSESNRQTKLLQVIQEAFNDQSRDTLEIKDICAPLNKLNVARTFNALLKFHSQQYVVLKTKDGNTETVLIYRGPLLHQ